MIVVVVVLIAVVGCAAVVVVVGSAVWVVAGGGAIRHGDGECAVLIQGHLRVVGVDPAVVVFTHG